MTLFTPNTKVGAINHIGIATSDLEASLKQYQELFDAPEAEIITSVEQGLRAVFILQGETHIELIEPLRADTDLRSGRQAIVKPYDRHHQELPQESLAHTIPLASLILEFDPRHKGERAKMTSVIRLHE